MKGTISPEDVGRVSESVRRRRIGVASWGKYSDTGILTVI